MTSGFEDRAFDWRRALMAPVAAAGLSRSDVLPTEKWLQPIGTRIADWPVPQRTREPAQSIWRTLVHSSCTHGRLGWLEVPTGGRPALAELVGADDTTLGRLLGRLASTAYPRVRLYEGERTKAAPPLVGLEVVPIIDTLAWLVPWRVLAVQKVPTMPTSAQLYKFTMTMLEHGRAPDVTIETRLDLARLIEGLGREGSPADSGG